MSAARLRSKSVYIPDTGETNALQKRASVVSPRSFKTQGPAQATTNKEASSIFVGMRVRPWMPREKDHEQSIFFDQRPGMIISKDREGANKEYPFDVVLNTMDQKAPHWAEQEEVYNKLGLRMVDHVFTGFNTVLFAYGQTGTGKSTTMIGDLKKRDEMGILPRLVNDLFTHVDNQPDKDRHHFKFKVLEIYNERVFDLLAVMKKTANLQQQKVDLKVKVHPKVGVYVQGLTTQAVASPDEVFQLVEYANTLKTVHSTAMNAQSSRSHTLFCLEYEKTDPDEIDTSRSNCFIVDLAGRENEKTTQVKGDRFVELGFINKSLFHLSQCIHALGTKTNKSKETGASATQSRFRNSKLTLLLAEALDGNSKTAMVGMLSPSMYACEDNATTLRMAATVKNIKVEVVSNKVNKKDLVNDLQDEITKLKAEMATISVSGGAASGPASAAGQPSPQEQENVAELEERLVMLLSMQEEYTQSWEAARTVAKKAQKERRLALGNVGMALDSLVSDLSSLMNKSKRGGIGLPYIKNFNEDPALNGKIFFSFELNQETTHINCLIGSDQNCDLVLRGMGIGEVMAEITNTQLGLFITHKNMRVAVNGRDLNQDEKLELKEQDQILFGRAYKFICYITDGNERKVGSTVAPISEENIHDYQLRRVLPKEARDDPNIKKLALTYVQNLLSQQLDMQLDMDTFLSTAASAMKNVEEANTACSVLRPDDPIRFELCSLAPACMYGFVPGLIPQLAVRLVQAEVKQSAVEVDVKTRLPRRSTVMINFVPPPDMSELNIDKRDTGENLLSVFNNHLGSPNSDLGGNTENPGERNANLPAMSEVQDTLQIWTYENFLPYLEKLREAVLSLRSKRVRKSVVNATIQWPEKPRANAVPDVTGLKDEISDLKNELSETKKEVARKERELSETKNSLTTKNTENRKLKDSLLTLTESMKKNAMSEVSAPSSAVTRQAKSRIETATSPESNQGSKTEIPSFPESKKSVANESATTEKTRTAPTMTPGGKKQLQSYLDQVNSKHERLKQMMNQRGSETEKRIGSAGPVKPDTTKRPSNPPPKKE